MFIAHKFTQIVLFSNNLHSMCAVFQSHQNQFISDSSIAMTFNFTNIHRKQ